MTLLDLLQRPNFAIAGATESVLEGEDPFARALRELFSGIGDIKGDKRAFGEVLERQGVGTITLADAIPLFEGTIAGNWVNTRGAAGLVLDAITDPLSYLSFGAPAAAKSIFAQTARRVGRYGDEVNEIIGKVALSPTSQKRVREITRGAQRETRAAALNREISEGAMSLSRAKQMLPMRGLGDEPLESVAERVLRGGGSDTIRGRLDIEAIGGFRDRQNNALIELQSRLDAGTITRQAFLKERKQLVRQGELVRRLVEGSPPKSRPQSFVRPDGTLGKIDRPRLLLPPGEAAEVVTSVEREAQRMFLLEKVGLAESTSDGIEIFNRLPADMLDNNAIRWAGMTILRRDTAKKYIADPVMKVLEALPGGAATINATVYFGEGLSRSARALFTPQGPLRHLGPGAREVAMRMRKQFTTGRALLAQRMTNFVQMGDDTLKIAPNLDKRWSAEWREHGERFGRAAYDLIEGTGDKGAWLSDAQKELVYEFDRMFQSMGRDLVRFGVLDAAVLKGRRYLPHRYHNFDQIQHMHELVGDGAVKWSGELREDFQRTRIHGTYEDSVRESQKLNIVETMNAAENARLHGAATPITPVLQPNYDLLANAEFYIGMYSNALARQAWRKQIIGTFGRPVGPWDIGQMYHLDRPYLTRNRTKDVANQLAAIRFFFRDLPGKTSSIKVPKRTLRGMSETSSFRITEGSKITEIESLRGGIHPQLIENADNLMQQLGTQGRQEFFRQAFLRARTSREFAEFTHAMLSLRNGEYRDFLPSLRGAIKDGEVESTLSRWYGEQAVFVTVRGGRWAEKGVSLPKYVLKDFEEADRRLLDSKRMPELRKILDGFDWLTSAFRMGAYTIWPASAVRDKYSNAYLGFLEIGLRNFDPIRFSHSMGVVAALRKQRRAGVPGKIGRLFDKAAGGDVRAATWTTKTGETYTYGEIADLVEEFGVAQSFVDLLELTGAARSIERATTQTTKLGRAKRGLKKRALDATRLRADVVDNHSRVSLFMANLDRGLSPADAADRTNQFLLDYLNGLSTVERSLARRLIPFYTFTRLNMNVMADTLRRNPGRILNPVRPFTGRESENQWMAKWEREGMKIRLDGDGQTVTMLNGIDFPVRNLNMLWRGSLRETALAHAASLHPFLKTTIEVMAQRDMFTDRPLSRTTRAGVGILAETLPKPMRDYLGYKKEFDKAGRPVYSFHAVRLKVLLDSWVFSRASSQLDRSFRQYVDKGGVRASALASDMLLGIKPTETNLDEQTRRTLQLRIRQVQSRLVDAGILREFSKVYEPKPDPRGLQ